MKTQRWVNSWDRAALATCVAIILMALTVLVGWHAHISAAVQIFRGLVPMQYNTALSFLALGAAGIGLITGRRLLLLGGGIFTTVMGATVTLEYVTGTSFGIDTAFFYPWERTLSAHPGRMALTTAISFFLSGGALIILALRRNAYAILGIVNSVPLSLALTSLVGYSFQINYVLPFNLGSQMALHTSAAFLAYGIAMLGYAWKYAERGPEGLPKFSPGISVAFLPVLLVAASALVPQQSWRVVPFEAAFSILGVAVITLAVLRLTTVKVAYKGLLMIAVPLILLLTFVGLVVRVKHESESAGVLSLRSKEVIGVSQSLLGLITDEESAVRGYVITGDEAFIDSHFRSLEAVTNTCARLRNLVSDSATQEARARKIEQFTAQRMDHLSQIVRLNKSGNKTLAEEIISGGAGKDLMNEIRAEMESFSQVENLLDAERRQVLETSWQKLSWLLVAGTSAAFLLASILTLLFSGGISRRLQQLRENAINLAAGKKLAPRLTGHDEIADLDRVFHEMAESLGEVTRRERAVIEGTTDAVFVKDLEHRFLMINQAGADLLGQTVEETIGASAHDLFDSDTTLRILERDAEILAAGQTTTYELQTTTKAGEERTYLTTRGPYRDGQGKVAGMMGINRDVTEQKQAAQALATSEKRYRALVDEGQGLICTHDLDGTLLSVNPAAAGSLGYTPGEMVGRNLKEYLTPAVQRGFTLYLQRIGAEQNVNGLLHLLNKQGEERIWMYRNSRIAEPGAMTYVLGYAQDVTDSKWAEEELRTLTQRLSLATQVGNIGVWDWDVQTNSIDWDERMFDIYGIAWGTPIDYDVWKAAVVAEDLPAAEAALHRAVEQKSQETSEFRILRSDGSLRHVQAAQGVILDRAGKVRRVIGLNLDITERKQLENDLRQERFFLRTLIDHIPDSVYVKDMECRKIIANLAEVRISGLQTEAEVLGKHDFELHPKDLAEKFFADDQEVLQTGQPVVNREEYVLDNQGHKSWLLTTKIPWRDEYGKIVGLIGLGRDITERKLIELELKESELQLVEAQHIALMGSWTWDVATNTTSWSRALYHIYGLRPEDCPATLEGYLSVVHPDDRKSISAQIEEAVRSGQGGSYEHRIIKPDKSVRFHHVNLKVVLDHEGRPVKLFGTAQDVTDRVHLEEDLKAARDEALESTRLKSEFLANMSHEIRTPMNGVIGMIGLLLETDLSSSQREFTETIESSADALMTIIGDILDFSKIEAGLLRFEVIDFELRGAVEAPVELLAERAQAKGLELASLVHREVPTALRGDPGRLRQVLTNLIGNAVKFTDRGEVVVSVTKTDETASHAMLRFEIQDTGIGISTEAQRMLFRAFMQADGSTTRKYGGTGLGLAISKQLVELMGGEIGIESTQGVGSTFWFTARFEKQLTLTPKDTKPADNLSGVRLLIVDNNATSLNILNHQASSWGMIVTVAASGKRALELLRAGVKQGEPFDVAVLDLMMPDLDGFQLAKDIKSDPTIAQVALVLLPSFGERGHGEKARDAGIDAYLQKPVRQSQLYDCLTTIIVRTGAESAKASELVTRHSMREADAHQKHKTLSSIRILIAEDNLVNQKVALRQLSSLGYRADAVSNGLELLKALENDHVDIILMDCQMPEMDGFAATDEIRRREGTARHTTIIALTANAIDGDHQRCLAAGMDDYLSKPVKLDELRQKLEQWTNTGESGRALNHGSEPAQHARASVIDQAQLASLREIQPPGAADFVTELIDLFLNEATLHLEALHEALIRDDAVEMQRLAHRLKGSSANMGAKQLAAISGELEKKDPAEDTKDLLAQLKNEFELVREALTVERKETEELAFS